MKIKESLKNTKEKISKGYKKHRKEIVFVGAGVVLTYVGYKIGEFTDICRTASGIEGLHKAGFIQYNDPMTGRKDISVSECNEAFENYKLSK